MLGLLAACSAQAPVPQQQTGTGPVDVRVKGARFTADLRPGPVLWVNRAAGFANDEGKLAKDVAEQFCASRQSRLNPFAYGHFVDGAWVFKGGCA